MHRFQITICRAHDVKKSKSQFVMMNSHAHFIGLIADIVLYMTEQKNKKEKQKNENHGKETNTL